MKTVYLIRHGAVNYQTEEYSLSDVGRSEAEKLGKFFKESKFPVPELIVSSDRPRTLQTAQLFTNEIGYKLNLTEVVRAPERDEQFPMKIFEELNTQTDQLDLLIDNTVQECNPPKEFDAEGPITRYEWEGQKEQVQAYIDFIERTIEKYDTVAVFSHANAIGLVVQSIFSDSLDLKSYGTGCMTSSMTVLTKIARWKISRLFSVEHLGKEKEV